jgi:ribonuclease HI
MGSKKYYVVWKGRETGVYESWKDCERSTKGFQGAIYMSFPTLEEAGKAYHKGWESFIGRKEPKPPVSKARLRKVGKPIADSLSVDAACAGNPGELEYRGVETATGVQIFHQGPFPEGTVNIGEFLAVVHALAILKKKGLGLPVYSDSRTAIKWVRDKKARTKLKPSSKNAHLLDLLARAELWLSENEYPNPVLKWETDCWGEIPADFGRK